MAFCHGYAAVRILCFANVTLLPVPYVKRISTCKMHDTIVKCTILYEWKGVLQVWVGTHYFRNYLLFGFCIPNILPCIFKSSR